jgi:hypothetical protein
VSAIEMSVRGKVDWARSLDARFDVHMPEGALLVRVQAPLRGGGASFSVTAARALYHEMDKEYYSIFRLCAADSGVCLGWITSQVLFGRANLANLKMALSYLSGDVRHGIADFYPLFTGLRLEKRSGRRAAEGRMRRPSYGDRLRHWSGGEEQRPDRGR